MTQHNYLEQPYKAYQISTQILTIHITLPVNALLPHFIINIITSMFDHYHLIYVPLCMFAYGVII